MLGTKSSAVLAKYLQDTNSTFNSLTPYVTNSSETTEVYSTYLQSNFSSKIAQTMSNAKQQLQTNIDTYIEAHKDSNSSAVTARITKMQENISLIDKFLNSKTKENTQATTNHQLMNTLSSNTAYQHYLLTFTK